MRNEDQLYEMLEMGAKLRKTKKWAFSTIREALGEKFNTEDVPNESTLLAFCRRRGVKDATPSNGTADKPLVVIGDIKLFRSPRKGKVMLEIPNDRVMDFIAGEVNLRI
jgi:hypothetical protein